MQPCGFGQQRLLPLPDGTVCKNVLQGTISGVETAWCDCEYFEPFGESLQLHRETVIMLRVGQTPPEPDSAWGRPWHHDIRAVHDGGLPESWQIRRAGEWLLLREKSKLLPLAELRSLAELVARLRQGPREATPIGRSRSSLQPPVFSIAWLHTSRPGRVRQSQYAETGKCNSAGGGCATFSGSSSPREPECRGTSVHKPLLLRRPQNVSRKLWKRLPVCSCNSRRMLSRFATSVMAIR